MHIPVITACSNNCSILLPVIVVNLFLRLIYKLNFLIGVYGHTDRCVQDKTWGFGTIHGFRCPMGSGALPLAKGVCCVSGVIC